MPAASDALLRLELDSIRDASRCPRVLLLVRFGKSYFLLLSVRGGDFYGEEEEAESICLFQLGWGAGTATFGPSWGLLGG